MNDYKIPFMLGFHAQIFVSAVSMKEAVDKAENFIELHLGGVDGIHPLARVSALGYTEDKYLDREGLKLHNPDFLDQIPEVPYSTERLAYLLSQIQQYTQLAQAETEGLLETAQTSQQQNSFEEILDGLATIHTDITDAQQTVADLPEEETEEDLY